MMANIFRERRDICGYTQCQLADFLGVGQTTVSKWENGVAYPHVAQLLMLQQILRIPDEVLLRGLRKIEQCRKAQTGSSGSWGR